MEPERPPDAASGQGMASLHPAHLISAAAGQGAPYVDRRSKETFEICFPLRSSYESWTEVAKEVVGEILCEELAEKSWA
jgi:hypothetical protein